MDDEEHAYQDLQEPLYRVETGNYECRLILRCRQDARARFAKLRSDVMIKLELLDSKHVQDIVHQLQRLISAFAKVHLECYDLLKENVIFPIEVDLSKSCAFTYPESYTQEDDEEVGEEAVPELMSHVDDLASLSSPVSTTQPTTNPSTNILLPTVPPSVPSSSSSNISIAPLYF